MHRSSAAVHKALIWKLSEEITYDASFVKVVKEILNQYCEVWSTSDSQQQFLKDDLGIPLEWLHEALVSSRSSLSV